MRTQLNIWVSVYPHEHISRNYVSNLNRIAMHAVDGRDSVLFWRCCDMLETSGFMDDFTFARYGQKWTSEKGVYSTRLARWQHVMYLTPRPILTLTYQGQHRIGSEFDIYDRLVKRRGGFKEWPLVQWPTRPLPYGPRRPLMKISKKNLHYSCQDRIFTPSNSVR